MKNPFSSLWKSIFDPFGESERRRMPASSRPISTVAAKPQPAAFEPVRRPYQPPPPPVEPEPEEEPTAREILENETEDHPKFAAAFKEELGKCTELSELLELYELVGEKSRHAQAILDKVEARTSDSFGDLETPYNEASGITPMTRLLLKRALDLAKEPADYVTLTQDADSSDEEDANLVRTAIETLDWPKEKWETLRDEANDADCSELVGLAQIKLVNFCTSAVDLLEYFLDYVDNWENEDKVLEAIYDKLFSVATRQELQIISKLAAQFDNGDCLHEAVDEFLKK